MSFVCCLIMTLAWSDESAAKAQVTTGENCLAKPICCSFKDVSLQEACEWFQYLMSVKIDIDEDAMQRSRSGEGRHLSLEEENVAFADVLAQLLKPMGLTYEVTEKGIHIMTGTVSAPVPPTQVDEDVFPFSEEEPATQEEQPPDSYLRSIGDDPPQLESATNSREIESRLTKRISVSFQETPLESVCRDLQSMTGINIVLDKVALSEAGVGLDQPLSLTVENTSLKSVLNLLLKQVNLTYEIKDDVILVTVEPRNIGGGLIQAKYPVAKYLGENDSDQAVDKLIKLITNTIAPESWESAGGRGEIQYFPKEKTLVIGQQTQDVAEQIQELLAALARDNPRRVPEVYSLPEKQGTWLTNVPFSERQRDAIDQVVYPVADLVVPADDMTPVVCKLLDKPFQPVVTTGEFPCAGKTLEDDLIKFITTKVDPESWECNGGLGKIQYFPLGMSLLVVNTKEVQKKVADLLTDLRKQQEIQDKEYALEMKLVAVQEEGEPKEMLLPKITMLQGRWFTMFEGKTVTLKEGTIQDLLTGTADKPAAVFLQSSRRPKIAQKDDDVHVGLAIRGKVTTLDAGRVRLDLILQKTELDSASRDDIVVVGTSVRSAQRIPVGQAFNHVLQENEDGEPMVWLEVKVQAVQVAPTGTNGKPQEMAPPVRGTGAPIPRP